MSDESDLYVHLSLGVVSALALLVLAWSFWSGYSAYNQHRLYHTCLEHHPVAECETLRGKP